MSTTNLPNGITNAADTSSMGALTQLDPSKVHTYYDDFNLFNTAEWVIATNGTTTQAIIDETGGILKLTQDTIANGRSLLHYVNETFTFISGKKLHFKIRFKPLNADDILYAGLQNSSPSPLTPTDGVYFTGTNASSDLNFFVTKNSVSSTVIAGTLSSDTYVDLAFVYDGRSEVQYWINDVKIGALDLTNLPDDEELTVSFGAQNKSFATVGSELSIDYVYVACER